MPKKIKESQIDDIINLYISGMSVADVAKRVGVNFKTADKYLCDRGVTKRTKSEASKLGSRKIIGRPRPDLCKPMPIEAVELYASGLGIKHIASMLHVDAKRVSAYLKSRGVKLDAYGTFVKRYGPEFKRELALRASKAALSSPRNDAKRAMTISSTKAVSGAMEKEFCEELAARGFDVFHQYPVDSYNIDIAINELNIAIEVHRGSWHGRSDVRPERLEHLFNRGWKVIIIQVSRWGAATDMLAICDKLVALFQILRVNPSSICGQYGVVCRDGKPSTRLPDHFNRWSRIPSL